MNTRHNSKSSILSSLFILLWLSFFLDIRASCQCQLHSKKLSINDIIFFSLSFSLSLSLSLYIYIYIYIFICLSSRCGHLYLLYFIFYLKVESMNLFAYNIISRPIHATQSWILRIRFHSVYAETWASSYHLPGLNMSVRIRDDKFKGNRTVYTKQSQAKCWCLFRCKQT